MWAIDLVTRLGPPGAHGETTLVVAVCPFSKWVEAAPVENKSSFTITSWFHSQIVCRFGVPWGIRVDKGKEFRGFMEGYCRDMGIRVLTVYAAHPQANGVVERYNRTIRSGLRKLAHEFPGQSWTEYLTAVLAGLRFLPTRLGLPPAWMVYKQDV